MKWTCIDVRTYNDNNGTKIFGKVKFDDYSRIRF